jgi:hypothetical protein
MKLTAAILASALMFFLGWWVGRLQREAERAKYYDPIAGTYHDGTAWPMRHATGGNAGALWYYASCGHSHPFGAACSVMGHATGRQFMPTLVGDEPGGGW